MVVISQVKYSAYNKKLPKDTEDIDWNTVE
jgi:hypothetical protein